MKTKTEEVISFLKTIGVKITNIKITDSESVIQTEHQYTKWEGQNHHLKFVTLVLKIVPKGSFFLEGIDCIGFDDEDDFPFQQDDLCSLVHKGLSDLGAITEWDCDVDSDDYTEYNRLFEIRTRWGSPW